jgi:hypothetical protein
MDSAMDGKGKPILFQGTDRNEVGPLFSPDGHWIAYGSGFGSPLEVYVREFVAGPDGQPEPTPPHLVSDGAGYALGWRDDGKELFYLSGDRKTIRSVEIATKPNFQFSATKLSIPVLVGAAVPAVAADGQRFLIAAPVTQNSAPPSVTIVQNWQALLKK